MRDQSTIRHLSLRTVRTEFGIPFPTTINPQTPLRDLSVAEALYGRYNNGVVSRHTLALTIAAMRDASAVVVSYHDAKGEQTARVLWPTSVTLTKEYHLTAWCYCTLRRSWQSFRLDRIQTIHPLTTPDDADEQNGPVAATPANPYETAEEPRAVAATA